MKTSELTGHALDWAVAMCEGIDHDTAALNIMFGDDNDWFLAPSTDWAQGGPIIEAWMIDVGTYRGAWRAARHVGSLPTYGYGPTPLIAAMRCYVASKLGDDVEIPEALCNQ